MRYFIILTISLYALFGCVTAAPIYSVSKGRPAFIEKDLVGTYEGSGLLKGANGNILRTYTSTLSGYTEDGVLFLRETYHYDSGSTKQFTYRISPTESAFKYDCVRIETLDKCGVERAGSSIMLNITTTETDFMQAEVTNTKHLFHFLEDGKLIKNTYYNKFLFLHDKDEITHYTRISQ
ncbi:MAG: DUF3833 family protein [Deferribacterales bacterium]